MANGGWDGIHIVVEREYDVVHRVSTEPKGRAVYAAAERFFTSLSIIALYFSTCRQVMPVGKPESWVESL